MINFRCKCPIAISIQLMDTSFLVDKNMGVIKGEDRGIWGTCTKEDENLPKPRFLLLVFDVVRN